MLQSYVYRRPIQFRAPQVFQRQQWERYRLGWLYDRATQQIVTAGAGPYSSESIFSGQTPSVQAGFIAVLPLTTDQGYPLSIDAAGIMSIDAGGDTARQSLTYNLYNTQLAAFYGAASVYINNSAPSVTTDDIIIAAERNQSITPVSIAADATDIEGDALNWATSTTLPGSIALSADGTFAGISPDADSLTPIAGTVTDIAGDAAAFNAVLIIGNVAAPDVGGLSQADASAAIEAAYLISATGSAVFSATVPAGLVASQSPNPGNRVAPFSIVTVSLSLGQTGAVSVLTPILHATYALNSVQSVDIAAYFSGGTTYSMLPVAPLAGETLVGSIFTPQTAIAGDFGPFLFAALNGTASAQLNEFTYTVSPAASIANPVRAIRFSTLARTIRFSVSF